MRVIKGFFKTIGTLLLVGILAGMIFCCIFAVYVKTYLRSQIDFSMEDISLDQTSVIYYWDSDSASYKELEKLYAEKNRTWVDFNEIPANLRFATVAIEDKRFFEHKGVDWIRTLKASVYLFLGDDSAGGASTITQQLIKNLTGHEEVTVRRKIVEIFTALEVAKKYSRDTVLEYYLNTIYLGEGCYGVQAASQRYFGKRVSDLTLAECASLISITNNPSLYDPYVFPQNNRKRQTFVLQLMLDQGYIDESEYRQAIAQEMDFHSANVSSSSASVYYSYFVDQVINDVVTDLRAATGLSREEAYNQLVTKGYQIYATIDLNVQKQLESVYSDMNNIPKTASSQQLQSAMAIIDNQTGDFVALVGGVGDKGGSLVFNRATQSSLSPGSTIKPLSVYAPALELGRITPASVYDDTPYSFTDSGYWPRNSDQTFRGLISVDTAVALSINTVAVKIVDELTPEYCFDFAKSRFGLNGLVESYTSGSQTFSDAELSPMAMGSLTVGVSVADMTSAYATFPNEGTYRRGRTYTRVMNGDTVILDNSRDATSAVSEKTAWYMTDMLTHAVTRGTGTSAQLVNMPVAGKTGTTNSNYDRWFAGYTPYYTAVTWCGYDDPEEVILTDTTENPAIVLWHMVMERIHTNLAYKDFDQPSDIVTCTYCADSGLLCTDACRKDPRGSREVTGMLSIHDVPTTYCSTHEMALICDASNHVVNEFCTQVPGNTTHEVGLLNLNRAFPIPGIRVQDQQYCIATGSVPSGYYAAKSVVIDAIGESCPIHNEDSVPEEEEEEERPKPWWDTSGENEENSDNGGWTIWPW